MMYLECISALARSTRELFLHANCFSMENNYAVLSYSATNQHKKLTRVNITYVRLDYIFLLRTITSIRDRATRVILMLLKLWHSALNLRLL